jgi:hypothetical protein
VKASREHIDFAIAALFRLGDVVELRIPKARGLGTISGYIDDFDSWPRRSRSTAGGVEARRIAFLVAGEKEEADRCQEAINDLQGRR